MADNPKKDSIEVFPALLDYSLENFSMLAVLMKAVGELLAEKRGEDKEETINKLFAAAQQVREAEVAAMYGREPESEQK